MKAITETYYCNLCLSKISDDFYSETGRGLLEGGKFDMRQIEARLESKDKEELSS